MNTGSELLQSEAGLLTTVAWQLGERSNRCTPWKAAPLFVVPPCSGCAMV